MALDALDTKCPGGWKLHAAMTYMQTVIHMHVYCTSAQRYAFDGVSRHHHNANISRLQQQHILIERKNA